MMTLSDKIDSLSCNNTVAELANMLQNARVTISWLGVRMVSVEGYEGSVEIHLVAKKFFSSNPCAKVETESVTISERLTAYKVWSQLNGLYRASNETCSRTWVVGYLTSMRDLNQLSMHCTSYVLNTEASTKEDMLFSFSDHDFQKYWPNQAEIRKGWAGFESHWWAAIATKEMVESIHTRMQIALRRALFGI